MSSIVAIILELTYYVSDFSTILVQYTEFCLRKRLKKLHSIFFHHRVILKSKSTSKSVRFGSRIKTELFVTLCFADFQRLHNFNLFHFPNIFIY